MSNTDEAAGQDPLRAGNGYLNIDRVLAAVRQHAAQAHVGEAPGSTITTEAPTASLGVSRTITGRQPPTQEIIMNQGRKDIQGAALETPVSGVMKTEEPVSPVVAQSSDEADVKDSLDLDFTPDTLNTDESDDVDESWDSMTYFEDDPNRSQLLDLAETLVAYGVNFSSSDAFLERLLAETGALGMPNYGRHHLAADIFDALVFGADPMLKDSVESSFDVCLPGTIAEIPLGSVMIRRALGEGKLAHTSIIASSTFLPEHVDERFVLENMKPGAYAQVVEANHPLQNRFARRLLDETKQLPLDTVVLIPNLETVQETAQTGGWPPTTPNNCIVVDGRPIRVQESNFRVVQGSFQFTGNMYPRRRLQDVVQLVMHETSGPVCSGADRVAHNMRNSSRTISIHFIIDADGTVYQYGDLAYVMFHSRPAHNAVSIGIEMIHPANRSPCASSYSNQRINNAHWAEGTSYSIPPLVQVEAVAKLIQWLTSDAAGLAIPRRWIGVRQNQMAMNRIEGTQNSRQPGIYAHTYWHHSDGAWPLLYSWLRIEAGLRAEEAYANAIRRSPTGPGAFQADLRGLSQASGSSEESVHFIRFPQRTLGGNTSDMVESGPRSD